MVLFSGDGIGNGMAICRKVNEVRWVPEKYVISWVYRYNLGVYA